MVVADCFGAAVPGTLRERLGGLNNYGVADDNQAAADAALVVGWIGKKYDECPGIHKDLNKQSDLPPLAHCRRNGVGFLRSTMMGRLLENLRRNDFYFWENDAFLDYCV